MYDHLYHINGSPLHREILRNIPSGLTVALVRFCFYLKSNTLIDRYFQVYIPLSISLGIASDAGPESGFITAVWAMMATGFLGGSHHNIVGPAGCAELNTYPMSFSLLPRIY